MDVDVDRARLARVVVAPNPLQELVAADHLARMAQEEGEELEDLRLQRDLLAIAQDAMTGDIDLDRPERHAWGQSRHERFTAAEHGADACR